ncbi:MAG: GIY-YIG nuclease family protein [Chitinophagaceae bacterium]|nr:GIY-YIG nuclease family protein [Chitinophagaceae bacterium]
MPFIVYIIYSKSLDSFYVGHTANLDDRLFRHNNSGSKSTKKAKDWILVYQEAIPTILFLFRQTYNVLILQNHLFRSKQAYLKHGFR